LEKTNYQENRIQQQEQQQQKQELFDSETKRKIQDSLKEIYNKQQATNINSSTKGKFIKFVHDSEHKRLSFTGRFERKQVPCKDFITNELIQGKFSDRYSFECYDIIDPDHPSELCIWERGPTDAKTILYWLSNDKNVLDIIRHGQPGSKSTTYDIHPPPMY
jgi:hypothetical protein